MLRKQPARLVALCNLQKPSVFRCDSDKIGIHERGHSWVTSGLVCGRPCVKFFEDVLSFAWLRCQILALPLGWEFVASAATCQTLSGCHPTSSTIHHHSPMVLQHTFCIFWLRSLRATALLISGSTEISSVCAGLVSCTKLRALKCGTEPA